MYVYRKWSRTPNLKRSESKSFDRYDSIILRAFECSTFECIQSTFDRSGLNICNSIIYFFLFFFPRILDHTYDLRTSSFHDVVLKRSDRRLRNVSRKSLQISSQTWYPSYPSEELAIRVLGITDAGVAYHYWPLALATGLRTVTSDRTVYNNLSLTFSSVWQKWLRRIINLLFVSLKYTWYIFWNKKTFSTCVIPARVAKKYSWMNCYFLLSFRNLVS